MIPQWKRSVRLVPLLVLATAIAATIAQSQQPELHRLRGDDVAIFSLAGETRVEAGGGADVEVEVVRGGTDAGRLRIETGLIAGRQTLRVIVPGERIVYPRLNRGARSQLRVRGDGTFGRGVSGGRRVTVAGSGNGIEAYADLRVRVPAGQRIAVHQGTGRVWVSNVDGEIRVDGASGPVETQGTRGSLSVRVGAGRVQVRDASGPVEVNTGSGSVEVAGVRGTRLKVETGSGSVTGSAIDVEQIDVEVGSGSVRLSDARFREGRVDTGSGGVQLSLADAVRSLVVDTGSGGVMLNVPAAFGGEFDVRTGSGGITLDLPTQQMSRSRGSLEARVGTGEARVRIRTGSGSVRVRPI